MNILLVEDDPDWVEDLRGALDTAIPHNQLSVATTRAQALELLEMATYDLIICDLKIPPDASGVDPEIAHGVAVLAQAGEVCPGTCVVVLSGFGELDVLQPFLMSHGPADYFGSGRQWAMRDHRRKNEVDRFLDDLAEFGREQRERDDIELMGAVVADLDPREARIIRAFARRHGGQTVAVESLNGGRSSARTLRLDVRNAGGALTHLAVAKLDRIKAVRDESDRYARRIHPLLPLGSYTDSAGEICVGGGDRGGCFYKLLEGYDSSLFAVLGRDVGDAAAVVDTLRTNLARWDANAVMTSKTLAEVRLEHAAEDVLAAACLDGLPIVREEARAIPVRFGTDHCDLHGGNVLVRADGHAVVIDYARAGETSVAFDPVTLELSAICHPDSPVTGGDWPSDAQWRQWFDLEAFVAGSPIEQYVRACRRWASAVTRGDRELLACGYAYLVRQVRYRHVPDESLRAGIEGILNELSVR